MDKFDFRAMRLIFTLLVICLVFIGVVRHAYKYLPAQGVNDVLSINKTVPTEEKEAVSTNSEEAYREEVAQSEESTIDEEERERERIRREEFERQRARELEIKRMHEEAGLEPLEDINSSSEAYVKSPEEILYETFEVARRAFEERDYSKAIENYKKVLETTEDSDLKADCYDKIAQSYALMKRYGSGISYAQKAYNISATQERTILLAKLLYRTGNTVKANDLMTKVLQKDFVVEER